MALTRSVIFSWKGTAVSGEVSRVLVLVCASVDVGSFGLSFVYCILSFPNEPR